MVKPLLNCLSTDKQSIDFDVVLPEQLGEEVKTYWTILLKEFKKTTEELESSNTRIKALQQQIVMLAKTTKNDQPMLGWLISGPSNTSIVFSRERIQDHIEALCKVNGDDKNSYSTTKVKLHIEFLDAILRGDFTA